MESRKLGPSGCRNLAWTTESTLQMLALARFTPRPPGRMRQ